MSEPEKTASEEPSKVEEVKKQANRSVSMRTASVTASASNQKKATKASSTSEFVQFTKAALEFQLFAIQAQLDLINSLASLSDEEKMAMIFGLLDEDGDDKIDARELASGIKRVRADLTFSESLEAAVERIAVFDTDDDARLNLEEFKKFITTMAEVLGTNFHELAELIILQVLFSPTANTIEEEIVGHVAQESGAMDEAVKETKVFNAALLDKRMAALFLLFDLDADGYVDFKEVAIGLKKFNEDMDASAKAAVAALLLFDKDDKRKLDYEEFTTLILNLIAASGADVKFDEVADALTLAACQPAEVTEEELGELVVADAMYEGLKDLQQIEQDITSTIDILQYGRMQRLFELWDLNKDGFIDVGELVLGLRKMGEAKDLESSIEDGIAVILTFDENADARLDKTEFAVALVKFAQKLELDLHDMVDFMVVLSALKDHEPAEKKFLETIGSSVTDQIIAIEEELEKLQLEDGKGE